MDRYEYRNLILCLVPYESDRLEDTDEWNLFDRYF
jgi:hypothetical protein